MRTDLVLGANGDVLELHDDALHGDVLALRGIDVGTDGIAQCIVVPAPPGERNECILDPCYHAARKLCILRFSCHSSSGLWTVSGKHDEPRMPRTSHHCTTSVER